MSRRKREVQIPDPHRIRTLEGVIFGWIDTRLQRDGWLQVITPEASAIYFFLCLAANREGVSFYSRARMGRELGLDDSAVYRQLRRLQELTLVAYRPFSESSPDGFWQVLPVPAGGPPRPLAPLIEVLADRLRSKIDARLAEPEPTFRKRDGSLPDVR